MNQNKNQPPSFLTLSTKIIARAQAAWNRATEKGIEGIPPEPTPKEAVLLDEGQDLTPEELARRQAVEEAKIKAIMESLNKGK